MQPNLGPDIWFPNPPPSPPPRLLLENVLQSDLPVLSWPKRPSRIRSYFPLHLTYLSLWFITPETHCVFFFFFPTPGTHQTGFHFIMYALAVSPAWNIAPLDHKWLSYSSVRPHLYMACLWNLIPLPCSTFYEQLVSVGSFPIYIFVYTSLSSSQGQDTCITCFRLCG